MHHQLFGAFCRFIAKINLSAMSGPFLTIIMDLPCCWKRDWLRFYLTVWRQSLLENFQIHKSRVSLLFAKSFSFFFYLESKWSIFTLTENPENGSVSSGFLLIPKLLSKLPGWWVGSRTRTEVSKRPRRPTSAWLCNISLVLVNNVLPDAICVVHRGVTLVCRVVETTCFVFFNGQLLLTP